VTGGVPELWWLKLSHAYDFHSCLFCSSQATEHPAQHRKVVGSSEALNKVRVQYGHKTLDYGVTMPMNNNKIDKSNIHDIWSAFAYQQPLYKF
jgi:hypothetical protein